MSTGTAVEVDGHTLELTNLEKVLYPATGFTKGQVIDYYSRVGPFMLPHLAGRPLTMKRFPDGVEGGFFYEKECPRFHPDWVDTATVPSGNARGSVDFCVIDGAASLVWVANLASLELHVMLSRTPRLERPTAVVFDLDPGEGSDILVTCGAALELKSLLDGIGLESHVKSSGRKGMHVFVPLNTDVDFESTRTFAREVARTMEERKPDLVTSNMRRDLRRGRVLIDWSQNDSHKTTVCAYSLRARERPVASTPVDWEEVGAAVQKGDASLLLFDSDDVLDRVAKRGDLFAPVLATRQDLPAAGAPSRPVTGGASGGSPAGDHVI